MIEVEYFGPPIDKTTRDAAWRRIVQGLNEIADSAEVLRAAGAWQFVYQLAECAKTSATTSRATRTLTP